MLYSNVRFLDKKNSSEKLVALAYFPPSFLKVQNVTAYILRTDMILIFTATYLAKE